MSSAALHALSIDLYGQFRHLSRLRLLHLMIRPGNRQAVVLIRLIQHCHTYGHRRLQHRLARKLRREFGCFVQPGAEIGPGLSLPHPQGIVIGHGVRIGARCTIFHQVTLGGARIGEGVEDKGSYPVVGDHVVLFSGAKVVGALSIGDRVQVGANAVVLRDVPDDHIAAGVPAVARPIRSARHELRRETLPSPFV